MSTVAGPHLHLLHPERRVRAVAGLAVPGQAGGRGQPRPGPGAGAARGAAAAAPARPRPAEAQGVRGALPGRLPREYAVKGETPRIIGSGMRF